MTREEFLLVLEKKLGYMSKQEKDEALSYYSEYIIEAQDSGKTWDEIIKALGTPDEVAARIKADYTINKVKEKPSLSNSVKTLIAVLGLCSLPIALPLAIVLIALVFVLVAVVFSVIISIIAAVFAALVGVGVAFGAAISLIGTDPVLGLGLLGLLLIATGLIILIGYGMIRLTAVLIVLLAKLLKKLIEKIKKEKK